MKETQDPILQKIREINAQFAVSLEDLNKANAKLTKSSNKLSKAVKAFSQGK